MTTATRQSYMERFDQMGSRVRGFTLKDQSTSLPLDAASIAHKLIPCITQNTTLIGLRWNVKRGALSLKQVYTGSATCPLGPKFVSCRGGRFPRPEESVSEALTIFTISYFTCPELKYLPNFIRTAKPKKAEMKTITPYTVRDIGFPTR